MSSKIVADYQCRVCGRPTTRLVGVGSIVTLSADGGTRALSEVLGYCLAHRRDQIFEHWRADIAAAGEVHWATSDEEVVDLRPAHAAEFLARTDAMFQQTLPQGPGQRGSAGDCPHCGGPVSWGNGPHVTDARQRPGAKAWECRSCGAAGIATPA